MITNLLVTISVLLSTNTTTWDNHQGCATCEGMRKNNWAIYHPPHEGSFIPYKDATERGTTTTVTETTRFEFTHDGKPFTLESSKVLTNIVTKEVLKQQWVTEPIEEKPYTPQWTNLIITNWGIFHSPDLTNKLIIKGITNESIEIQTNQLEGIISNYLFKVRQKEIEEGKKLREQGPFIQLTPAIPN